ncbi:MAG: YmdB family metallophosphoesterase [Butyricicoccus sp.]
MYDVALAEIHANATSEKLAMGYYLDGRAAAVWGTRTHVRTADRRQSRAPVISRISA